MIDKVFTNGCFDIIHPGHIKLLKEAKKLGKHLIVGINSDASISRLKGDKRPINSLEDRKEVLLAIKYVDSVISFDEDTPYELIKQINPGIIVKGGDYKPEGVVGSDLAKVEIIELRKGKSTTNIVEKINEGNSEQGN